MLASNLDLLTGSYLISFVDILVHKYTEHLIWFSTCQTTIWSEHVANCILRKNSIDECIVILFLVLLIILSHDPKIFCINMYVLLYMHVSAMSTLHSGLPKIMQYTNTTNISWRVILYLSYMQCPLPQPTNTVFFGPTKLYPPPNSPFGFD